VHSSPVNSAQSPTQQSTHLASQQSARTRVKICGITRLQDALAAVDAGADAIGLVFYAKSPRAVSMVQANAILRELPPFVTTVGLFVNASQADVDATLQTVPLDLLQFHGDESEAFCSSFSRPYIKALRVKPPIEKLTMEKLTGDMHSALATVSYKTARGLLLDAWDEKLYGGTGQTFDWHAVEQIADNARIILAGGLTPANVADAIRIAKPWGVDVSSGVEEAPGIKSSPLIKAFISEVNRV
jgi:phosphoribosylanthranilate isomerase